jgi:nucleotide-binding universal stress UspA family protein
MSYAVLMVQLELGQANAGALAIAHDLAGVFDAHVIGIAVRRPIEIGYGDGFIYGDGMVTAGFIDQGRAELDAEALAAEQAFYARFADRAGRIDWRSISTFAPLADQLAIEARSADLVISHIASRDLLDATRRVDTGDLVMQAGRPVLIVPPKCAGLALNHVMLAWKDSRETRRAVADALPMLKKAARVTVVALAGKDELAQTEAAVTHVLGWLGHHGVGAERLVETAGGDDADQLQRIALTQGADMIVAGAYGHSRMREWALGGVTRDLLMRDDRPALVSH